MALPNTFHLNKRGPAPLEKGHLWAIEARAYSAERSLMGFTLIEIVVAIAILGIILSFGLIVSLDSYRGYIFRTERSTIVSVLTRARNKSLANINQQPHGACYDDLNKNYVIFDGSSFAVATNPTTVQANPSVSIASNPNIFLCGSNVGVVFAQLIGTTTRVDIGITQNNRVSTTSINYEGTINW
jgi:prepilin-type N-terminal cleavage/methylation domain-containing protein